MTKKQYNSQESMNRLTTHTVEPQHQRLFHSDINYVILEHVGRDFITEWEMRPQRNSGIGASL